MEIQKQNLEIYIKQMAHYDPDNMEMGARAVSELVTSGQLELQENPLRATMIREAFIKQMQSDNYNVHAHAIKCVADMIAKLPADQVQIIFEKTIKSIADPDLDQKKREIYGVCAGTMIHQASEEFGSTLCELFVESVNALLETKDRVPVEIMLINVISEFIRKWPNVAGSKSTVFNRSALIIYLLNNIENRPNYELVRKSQSALGKMAMIIHQEDLKVLFEDKKLGLINYLGSLLGKYDANSLKATREAVTCLSYVLKTHNPDLRLWAEPLAIMLIDVINKYTKDANIDQIDRFCDIVEGALVCQSYNIKSFSRELGDLLSNPQQPLNRFVTELINFDIEGMMSYISLSAESDMTEEAEDEGDYGDYYMQDNEMQQKCWKVRRAILHYITVLIKKDKSFRDKMGKSEVFIMTLGSKLVEDNAMVNQTAVEAFNSLIEAISIEKHMEKEEEVQELGLMRIKSSETDFATMILSEIQKRMEIIFSSSKFNDEVKGAMEKLILRMINVFKADLAYHPALTTKIIHQAEQEFSKTNIVERKITLLQILRELIYENIGFKNYERTLAIFLRMSADGNFKVAAAAYKGLFKVLSEFVDAIAGHKDFEAILKNIVARLRQHDIDKTVKKSVMKCAGCIFELHFDRVKEFMQNQFLEALEEKLKIEIQRGYILSQIIRLSPIYKVKKSQIKIFTEILKRVIESLGSMNFDLNLHAVESTKRIIEILQNNLDKKIVNDVMQKTKPLLMDSTLPSYVSILMQRYPAEFKPYIQPIIRTADIDIILNLIRLKITDTKSCIAVLKQTARPDKAKKVSMILGRMGVSDKELIKEVDDSLWGQISLGALGYIGSQGNYSFLLGLIREGKCEEIKFQACSALGNIASRDHDKIVPMLILEADKSQDCYLYIYTIREMLAYTRNQFKDLQILTDWLLAKAENRYDGESVYYVISECIGKVAMLSSKALGKMLMEAMGMSENKRYIFANSLRFEFEERDNLMDCEEYENYVKQIITFARDSSVQVRHGSMKSLSAISATHFGLIKASVNQAFWTIIKNNLIIDQSLIIEVDYGITKQKKDTGKPLRLESYNFLKLAISKFPIEGQVHDLMRVCLDKIEKETSTDLILKRINTIKILCQKDFSNFISLQNQFKNKLGLQEGILKSYQVQKEAGDERTDVFLKGLFKEIIEISVIAEKEGSDQIRGFIIRIRSSERYNAIIDSLEAN